MYSPLIVEKSQANLEEGLGYKLKRYSPEESWDIGEHLDNLKRRDPKLGVVDLSPELRKFVENENLLSRIDFRYFARWVLIELDGGGSGPFLLKESQEIALDRHFAPAEEEMWEQVDEARRLNHEYPELMVGGIRFYWNKARQLYATTTSRVLTFHRIVFNHDFKAMAAPADDKQIMPLYERDKRLYDGLRWWMRPSLEPEDGGYDVKGEHIYFGLLRSGLVYYSGSKKGGIGQGSQFQIQHLTEAAFWNSPEIQIDMILDPTLPQSVHTLAIRESTAFERRNWWHYKTEEARAGRSGWGYIFMPWYVVSSKRRRIPPTSEWRPDPLTLAHADLVLRTSAEWTGKVVTLTREQLYWWESERKEHQKSQVNGLAMFYSNYPATPEESFQNLQAGAFTLEQLERWRLGTSIPSGVEALYRG